MSLWACTSAAVHDAGGNPGRIKSPLRSYAGGDDDGVGSVKIRMRFVLVLLLALGLDPRCSPMGFVFLVGDFVTGCGFVVRESTAGWLVADANLVCEKNTAGWLTNQLIE